MNTTLDIIDSPFLKKVLLSLRKGDFGFPVPKSGEILEGPRLSPSPVVEEESNAGAWD